MMLKSATIYAMDCPTLEEGEDGLQELLAQHASRELDKTQMLGVGLVPPLGRTESEEDAANDGQMDLYPDLIEPAGQGLLYHKVGNAVWLLVEVRTRQIPAGQLERALRVMCSEFEMGAMRKPTSVEEDRMRVEAQKNLLPLAPEEAKQVSIVLNQERHTLLVGTTTRSVADLAVRFLRDVFEGITLVGHTSVKEPERVMTGWLDGSIKIPEGIVVGDECELQELVKDGAVVRCKRQDMDSDEITTMLDAGKKVTRMRQSYDGKIAYTLCSDLTLRSIKLLDPARDELESTAAETEAARLDAEFALTNGLIEQIWEAVCDAFDVSAKKAPRTQQMLLTLTEAA